MHPFPGKFSSIEMHIPADEASTFISIFSGPIYGEIRFDFANKNGWKLQPFLLRQELSEAITHRQRKHIGVQLDVDALARRQMNLGLQKALGVGRIHKPALVEVVDKTQLRQGAKLVIHLGRSGVHPSGR